MINSSRINQEIKKLESAYRLEIDPKIKTNLASIIDRKIVTFIAAYTEERKAAKAIQRVEDEIEERRRNV